MLPTASLAAPDAATIIAGLKRGGGATTAYTEVRFVDMLDAPMILTGELQYLADGGLVKRVAKPYRETTTVGAGGEVTVEREGRETKTFTLKRAAALGAFLESFAGVLGGDAARLAQSYTVAIAGDESHWSLKLMPRDKSLSRHVSRIEIDGETRTPLCFRVQEANGDSSVLLVERLARARLSANPTKNELDQMCKNGT